MISRLRQAINSTIVRSVGVLAGGTALSQALTILALPILTRLYSPDDFSVLAVYAALLAILSSVACLRFEIAIPLPQTDEAAVRLLVLALLSVVVVAGLTFIAIVTLSGDIERWGALGIDGYIWLLPVGIFFSGFYTAFQYWAVRKKNFKEIAKTRVYQSVSAVGTQIGLGFYGIAPVGLLLGQVAQAGAGGYRMCMISIKTVWQELEKTNWESLWKTCWEYRRFPKYSTWEALANSGSIQLPIIIIAGAVVGPEAGFILLAMRLLSAPMGLIGGAVAQVYLAEAAVKHQASELEIFTRRMVFQLVRAGFLPIFVVAVGAPIVVPLVFGSEWGRVGDLISWMAPWFFMQFIASPVSMSLHVIGRQKEALVLQVTGFFIRTGAVIVASMFLSGWVGEIYAVSGVVFYTIYIFVIFYFLKNKSR